MLPYQFFSSLKPFKKRFVKIPRIKEQAIVVSVTFPKETLKPPIPGIKIAETTKRFLPSLRSTFWIIFRPETAIKPYRAMQTPPMTQLGMEERKVTKGPKKEITMLMIAAVVMVMTDAFLVIATQPTDSP